MVRRFQMVIRQRLSDVAKQLGRSPATGLSLEVENSLRTTVHLITGLRFRSILFTGDSFQFAFSLSTTCFKIILSYGRWFPVNRTIDEPNIAILDYRQSCKNLVNVYHMKFMGRYWYKFSWHDPLVLFLIDRICFERMCNI